MSDLPVGRALSLRVALEVMRWTQLAGANYLSDRQGKVRTLEITSFGQFDPAADWSSCREMEEQLVADGLGERYAAALAVVVAVDSPNELSVEPIALIMASCDQRCRAAMEVCAK